MGKLTTHVLNTADGVPASGMRIALFSVEQNQRKELKTLVTNADGRIEGPLLEGEAFKPGAYELVFQVGDYFAARSPVIKSQRFLDEVPVRFSIADSSTHFHVPLLVSQWSYSTYRGS